MFAAVAGLFCGSDPHPQAASALYGRFLALMGEWGVLDGHGWFGCRASG